MTARLHATRPGRLALLCAAISLYTAGHFLWLSPTDAWECSAFLGWYTAGMLAYHAHIRGDR